MDYKNIYKNWLNNDFFDDETKDELKKIENDENEMSLLAHGQRNFVIKFGVRTEREKSHTKVTRS